MGKMGALGVLDLEGLWTRYDDPQPLLDEIAELPAESATERIQQIYAEPIKPIEFIGVNLPRSGHILRIASTTGGNDGNVVQRVRQTTLLAQTDFNFLRHASKANAQQ